MASTDRLILRRLAPFLLLTLLLGFLSDGVHHDDDLTHFLMARWAWWYPGYLLHIWARPGLTVPLAAVAWIGDSSTAWHACRILSALVTTASTWIAARWAMRLGIAGQADVILACAAQPLNTVLACTTLTENFTSLYLVGSLALLHAGRPLLASAIFSLVLLTRHEAVIFLPIWWIAIIVRDGGGMRKTLSLAATIWAPIIHNVLYRACFEDWPIRTYFQARGSTEYLPTGPFAYVPDAIYALTPAIAALACIGAIALLRRRRILVPAMVGTFFLTHAVLKAMGLFASGGYGRFMVAVAPLTALLAAAGWAELRSSSASGDGATRRRWAVLISAFAWAAMWLAVEVERSAGRFSPAGAWTAWAIRLAALIVLGLHLLACGATDEPGRRRLRGVLLRALGLSLVIQWCLIVRPLSLPKRAQQVRAVVDWLDAQRLGDAPFFATDPWFPYYLDLVENPRAYKGPSLLASMPVGTVFVWDSIYSPSDYHCLRLAGFLKDPHYELLNVFRGDEARRGDMVVFRKTSPTPLPAAPDAPYPPPIRGRGPTMLGSYYIRPASRHARIGGNP